ncbi:MAG: hypothetical protein OHM56_03450 [Spiroplasma phoeniceum]|nr:MAG: hypothetical protein OHM56_03450 [Spiroplasma phoeniceum]
MSFGGHRLSWKKDFLQKDWWISLSYPFFYLMYVIVLASAWKRDGNITWAYPYPFLDIDNPIISGLSRVQAAYFIAFIFIIVFTIFHISLHSLNNGMYSVFNKNQTKNKKRK